MPGCFFFRFLRCGLRGEWRGNLKLRNRVSSLRRAPDKCASGVLRRSAKPRARSGFSFPTFYQFPVCVPTLLLASSHSERICAVQYIADWAEWKRSARHVREFGGSEAILVTFSWDFLKGKVRVLKDFCFPIFFLSE